MALDIVYVYFSDFETSQAHGNQIIHTTNSLQERGHEVTIVSAGDITAYAQSNGLKVESETTSPFAAPSNPILGRLVYYIECLREAWNADVVFTRDIYFMRFLSTLPEALHPPVVYEAHQCYSGIDQLDPDTEADVLSTATTIITQSRGVAEDLRSLSLGVEETVPNAANLDLLPEREPEEIRRELEIEPDTIPLVYSGSLHAWKNDMDLLLDAFAQLQPDNPNIQLFIIGGDQDQIDRLKDEHEIARSENVRFEGRIPQEDVFDYLSIAEVGFVPLKSNDTAAERYTSPIKLFEYLASETIVVASDVPAIKNISDTTESVYIYEEGSRESLSTVTESVLERSIDIDQDEFSYRRRGERLDEILQTTVD